MNSYKDYYLEKDTEDLNSKEEVFKKSKIKYKGFKLLIFHKIINYINTTLFLLIFILSFFSLRAQNKWTNFYINMLEIKNKNNKITDYISITEEYFLEEIELKDGVKNTNPEDLIYLERTKKHKKNNHFFLGIKEIMNGFNDGKYQRGY